MKNKRKMFFVLFEPIYRILLNLVMVSPLLMMLSCAKTCQQYAEELNNATIQDQCTKRPLNCLISAQGLGYCKDYLYFGFKPHLENRNGTAKTSWQLCEVDFNSIENFSKDLFVIYNETTNKIIKGAYVSVYNSNSGSTGRLNLGDLVDDTYKGSSTSMVSVETAKNLINKKITPSSDERFSTSVTGGKGIETIIQLEANYLQFRNYALGYDQSHGTNCFNTLDCIVASDYWKNKLNDCKGSGYGFNCDNYNIENPMDPKVLPSLSSVYGNEIIYPMHVVEPEQKIGSKRIHYLIDKTKDKQYDVNARVMSTQQISRYIYIIVDFNKVGNLTSAQNYLITYGPKNSTNLFKIDASYQNGRIRYCGKGKMVVRFDLIEEGDMEASLFLPDGITKVASCDIFVSAIDEDGNTTRRVELLPISVNSLTNPRDLRTKNTFNFTGVLQQMAKYNSKQTIDPDEIKQIFEVDYKDTKNASEYITGVGKYVDNSGNLKISSNDLDRIVKDPTSELSIASSDAKIIEILRDAGISSTFSNIYATYYAKYKTKTDRKGIIMYVNDIEIVNGGYSSEQPASLWVYSKKPNLGYSNIQNSLVQYGITGPVVLNSAYIPVEATYCSVSMVFKKNLSNLIPPGSNMTIDNVAALALAHEFLHLWDNNKIMGRILTNSITQNHNEFHNGNFIDKCIFGYYSPTSKWATIFDDWNTNGVVLCDGHSDLLKQLFRPAK